jgi:DNA-binding IscR family transcriptional regulator
MLARPAENIILSEIIQVTDSPFTLVECVHDEDLCNVHQYCPTQRPLIALHNKIQQFIEETNLAAIIKDAQIINPKFEDSTYEIAHLS